MEIAVCGIGAISAIGLNCDQAFNSLTCLKSGVGALTMFNSTVETVVGEVKLTNTELKKILNLPEHLTLSRTALIGMVAASEAVRDSGVLSGNRIGFISATTVGGMDLSEKFYREFKGDARKGRLRDIIGHDCAQSTNQIAEYCKIDGFRTTISTACSSAANAIILGAQMIERGMLDFVVAGGTDALCSFTINGFNSLMILSKKQCQPFDNNRCGINLGEGAGYVVLCKKENAPKNYCTLSGYANTNDAFHQTASSDNGEGAYLAITEALRMAELSPSDINYINAHGTATPNNDLTEGRALARAFGDNLPPFSSTKGYTGHTLAASGGIEAVFSIMALEREAIYASYGFSTKIEELDIIPIRGEMETLQQKIHLHKELKHVLTNSFGFGGNCSSLIFSKV